MDPRTEQDRTTEAPVIETASATTSSQANRSGSFSYVVAVIAIVTLALIGSGLGSCVSFFARAVVSEAERNIGNTNTLDRYFEGDPSSPLHDDELLEFLEDNGIGSGSGMDLLDTGGAVDVTDVLTSELAIYGDTINSLVPAMGYSGAQSDVADFSRTLTYTDRQATEQVVSLLRAAARGDITSTEAAERAEEIADTTVESLESLRLPVVTGERADEVSSLLTSAREEARGRWTAISEEMDLIEDVSSVSTSTLLSLEKSITDATSKAAESLSSALATSAAS